MAVSGGADAGFSRAGAAAAGAGRCRTRAGALVQRRRVACRSRRARGIAVATPVDLALPDRRLVGAAFLSLAAAGDERRAMIYNPRNRLGMPPSRPWP